MKRYLRTNLTGTDEDDLLCTFINAAMSWANGFTKRELRLETWEIESEITKNEVSIPIGAENVLTFNKIGTNKTPVVSMIKDNCVYLELIDSGTYIVEYQLGYETLPDDIVSAMLIKIGSLYDRREETNRRFLTSAECLLRPYAYYNVTTP